MRRGYNWNEIEDSFVIKYSEKMSVSELAKALQRTELAITNRLRLLRSK